MVKKFTFKQAVLGIGATMSLAACNSYIPKDAAVPVAVSNTEMTNPAYATVQTQVFQQHCYECHSATGGSRGGVNLETYANVIANLDSIKDEVLTRASMPPKSRPSLSDAEKELLTNWLNSGAPETIK